MSLLSLARSLLSFLIPPRATEAVVEALSEEELRSLWLSSAHAVLPYHEPRVKSLIWELKYYRNQKALGLAASLLADKVSELCADSLEKVLLIPAPMDAKRRKERGFDHTAALARSIEGKLSGYCEMCPALRKVRSTRRQVELSKTERETNLIGTFTAVSDVSGRTCIVVDDVTTTGATFAEATRALAQAGARRILCLALARS